MVFEFISEHKKLTIGVVLYIAVFITGLFISPWDSAEIIAGELENGYGFTNEFMNRLPFELLYSGIAELIESLYYVQSLGSSTMVYTFFFFTVCAMFTYTSALKHLILDGRDYFGYDMSNMDDLHPVEKIVIDYLYDNVGIFLSSVLVRNLYMFASQKFIEAWDMGNVLVNILLAFAVAVLIVIPMLPNLLYIVLYMLGIQGIIWLANIIDINVQWLPFFKIALMLVATVLLLIVLNFLSSIILELFQKKTILLIGEIGERTAEGAFGMLKLVGVLMLIVAVVSIVVFLNSCAGA